MAQYKYILTFSDGETLDSFDENGDSGVFDSYDEAEDDALYAISCALQGAVTLNLSGDNDEDYDEDEDISYQIVEI